MPLNLIQQRFDYASQYYDDFAAIQSAIAKQLISLIPQQAFPHAIDLGCGTGFGSEHLLMQHSIRQLDLLDISAAMLSRAERRLAKYKINVYQADFINLPSTQYNLIFANMALHWADNLLAIIQRCYQQLASQGLLVFSLPLSDTFAALKPWQQFMFPGIAAIKDVLPQSTYYAQQSFTINYANLRRAHTALKQMGVSLTYRHRGLHLNREQRDFCRHYSQQPIALNYEILFVKVAKP